MRKTSQWLVCKPAHLEYLRPLMRLWSRLRASEPAEPATVVRSALLRVSRGYFFGYFQNISEQNKDISVLISFLTKGLASFTQLVKVRGSNLVLALPKHLRQTLLCPFWTKKSIFVQKGQDGPKRVPNGQKHLG